MATPILDLPAASNLTGSESLPLVQNGTTKYASVNQILDLVETSGIDASDVSNTPAGSISQADSKITPDLLPILLQLTKQARPK